MRHFNSLIFVAAAVLAIGVGEANADWTQFQGTNRDGISNESVKLAEQWPEGGPKVVWKIDDKLGTGYGGTVVEGGKVYLLDRVNDQQDVLRCIDLATGKEEWKYAYDAPVEAKEDAKLGRYKGSYNGSRNMPAVDKKNVYLFGPFGDVTCVSKQTHQAVWTKNVIKDYDATLGNWGMCQSPVLYKNTMIVAPLSKQAGIVAFDKETGKELWKSEPIGGICWTSPFVTTVEGTDMVVMLVERDSPRLVGLDVATGKKLWMYRGWKCANPITSQTYCGDGKFFISGGYKAGSAMVQVKKDGEQWKAEELFQTKECGAWSVKPVFLDGYLYANSTDLFGEKEGKGLMCIDLTGKVMWQTSNTEKEENGSILVADGKIYQLVSESGKLKMARATSAGYQELGSAQVTTGKNIWAPMAISDGKLLVRNRRSLICLDVSAK